MAKGRTRSTSDESLAAGKLLESEEPIEPENVTVGDILGLLRRLTLKTIVVLLGMIAAYTSTFFVFGHYVAMKDSGITLNNPFDMRISVTKEDKNKEDNGTINYTLDKLILVESPFTKSETKKCYTIFREFEPLDDRIVGQVECLVGESSVYDDAKNMLFGLSHAIPGDTAFAQSFSLGAHLNDNNYTQSFVAADTIRRKYNDGCVLQFKIDENGIAIAESYVWIVYKH